ncbi:MAG: hypothetical protein HYW49_10590 [Deltaproteobacteria bacterium]|nr:hypothetical protein [Deltaproteobacteria bacterium]
MSFRLFACLFAVTLLFAGPRAARAADAARELTPEELREIRVTAKITDLWVKFARQYPDESETIQDDPKWERALRPFVEKVIEVDTNDVESLSAAEKIAAKLHARQAMDHFRWKNLFKLIRDARKSMRTTARLHGVGMMSALSASFAAEFMIPLTLTALGHPELVPISVFTPYQLFAISLNTAGNRILIRKQMAKLLGGEENYDKFMLEQRELRAALKITAASELLVPFTTVSGQTEVASIARTPLHKRIFALLGFNDRSLTFENLLAFCRENRIETALAESLDRTRGLSKVEKTFLLTTQISATATPEQITRFRIKFMESFTATPWSSGFEGAHKWALGFAHVATIEEALDVLRQVPAGLSPAFVARTWKAVALPMLAENAAAVPFWKPRKFLVSYWSFRRLAKGFLRLEVASEQAAKESWGSEWVSSYEIYARVAAKRSCAEHLARDTPPIGE